ncbi:MAG: 2-phospho-L-lactate transferase [Nitrososphaerota archaeon]
MITVIGGGTGSVKLVRAIAKRVQDLQVISNVADNIWLMGLYICPDIDTIVYGLSGHLDIDKGWGVKEESYNFLEQLKILGQETWFRIGDKDLATHVMRTKMLKEGHSLLTITDWIRRQYKIQSRIIPVTNNHVETRIITDEGEMHIQEFWVKNNGRSKVHGVRYEGLKSSIINQEAIDAIRQSEIIVIAPGNPVSSIWPIVSHKVIKKELVRNRKRIVAISPIIGSNPISGPAAKYMNAVGVEVSVAGVASLYSEFASNFVISSNESPKTIDKLEKAGLYVSKTDIIMRDNSDELNLADFVLGFFKK